VGDYKLGKGKLAVLVCLVCVLAAGGWWFYHTTAQTNMPASRYANLTDFKNEYQAKEEIEAATKAYDTATPAKVIVGKPGDTTKEIAVTFDGMADRGVMEGILTALQKVSTDGYLFP
jgi:hypothetical protein